MSWKSGSARPKTLSVNLDNISESRLAGLDLADLDTLVIYLPLPSFNVTNSHIDICEDILEASWVAERLARCAVSVASAREVPKGKHHVRVRLVLRRPTAAIKDELEICARVYRHVGDDDVAQKRWEEIRDLLMDYEESIGSDSALVPQLIEWYLVNFVSAAMYQIEADAPEWHNSVIQKHPERQLGFWRSPYSHQLGATCFTSMESWVLPTHVDLDHFFKVTGQKARASQFMPAEVFVVDGRSCIHAAGTVALFPMKQYFKSRACASFALRAEEDRWPSDIFNWQDASFSHSEELERLRLENRAPGQRRENCRLHESGTLAVIDDGKLAHVLYEVEPLNQVAVKQIHQTMIGLAEKLWSAAGDTPVLSCKWAILDDEMFEQLCYDVIYAHPRFDSETIRKLGKSRSRDGGRDIEVYERSKFEGEAAKKWLFQCKLITNGSSLTATRLVDIGDMLDLHHAQGFGVMTSALIDSTLYDKMDAVCARREVAQLHFSVLELERSLLRTPDIRRRYFPSQDGHAAIRLQQP